MQLREIISFDVEKTAQELSKFIKDSVREFRTRGVIIGLSGGIDSACVCGLAVMAIEANKVYVKNIIELSEELRSLPKGPSA